MNNLNRAQRLGAGLLCAWAYAALATAQQNFGFGGLTSVAGLDRQQTDIRIPKVQSWNTEAGSRVLFVPARELPMIDIEVRIAAGSAADADKPGLAALTLYMIDEDTRDRSAYELAERLDSLGVKFSKSIHRDYVKLSLRSLSAPEQRDAAVDLLIEMLARPALKDAQLQLMKSQWLAIEERRRNIPATMLKSGLYSYLFAGHAYAEPPHGIPETVKALTVQEVENFHASHYVARNLSLSIVGDLSQADAQAIAQKISQALPAGNAQPRLPAPALAEPEILHLERPGSATTVMLAFALTVHRSDPDYLPLLLASEILGGGINSRLMQELRVARGLSYGIRADLIALDSTGVLGIEWDVAAGYNDGSQDLVLETVKTLISQGPTQEELDEARQQLAVHTLKQVSQNGSLAELLNQFNGDRAALDQYFANLQHAPALTPDDIKAALQRHLDPDRAVFISIGPDEKQTDLPPRYPSEAPLAAVQRY